MSEQRRRPRRRAQGRGGSGRSSAPRTSTENIEPLHPVEDPPDIESFQEWELGDELQQAIRDMGITKPTPIQALAIGPGLEGRDVIAKAETGTGKTLAFGAPIIAKLDPSRRSVLALILSPTRELAEQVADVMQKLGEARGLKTVLIVGGEPLQPQVNGLQDGAQIVVGTPGRVLDLMGQGFLSFPWTEFAVLDEADKMLEIGFLEDIEKILDQVNEYRQTLLFSATFDRSLLKLARSQTKDPVEVATSSGHATVDTIRQTWMKVDDEDRPRVLAEIVRRSGKDDVFLVFCDRRTEVDRLLRRMERERYPVKALHGGYDQAARFRVMAAFRTGEVKVLIATDVASRGLDVNHVTHVVNYAAPRDSADYTHRIGRTGRAGRQGTSVTFVSARGYRDWQQHIKTTGFEAEELHEPRDLFREVAPKGGEDGPGEPDRDRREPDRERRERGPRGDRGRDRKPDDAGDERPRRGPRDDGSDDGPREERAPREGGRRRRGRDERPEREPRDGNRERRPRRDRDERPREDRPRRESREDGARRETARAPQATPEAPQNGGGFGLGLNEPEPRRKKEEPRDTGRRRGERSDGDRPRRDDDRKPRRDPRPERPARPEPGGFGAGL